jgi:signal transduction histidine kinase/ActR/RegA family two-component response regulator
MRYGGTTANGPREARGESRFITEATQLLGSSLDYEATVEHVARLLVPSQGDWAVVDLLSDDRQHFERVAVAYHRPGDDDIAREIKRVYPLRSRTGLGWVETVVREGHSLLLRDIDDEALRRAARDDRHLHSLRRAGMRSSITAPLVARGRPIGSLTIAACDRNYDRDDVVLVERFALLAATAVENARLFRAEGRARARLERMQTIVTAISRASTTAEIARAACRVGCDATGAYSSAMWLLQKDGSLSLVAHWGTTNTFMKRFERIGPEVDAPAQRVARTGEPEWVETEEDYAKATPTIYASAKALGRVAAFGVVPLRGVHETLGVLTFAHRLMHVHDAEERAFYLSLAQHCSQALERALLFDECRRSEARIGLLQAVTASLSKAASAEEVVTVIVEEGTACVGSFACGVWFLEPNGESLRLTCSRGYNDAIRGIFSRVPLDANTPIARCVRDGAPLWIGSREEYARSFPESEAKTHGLIGVCVPFIIKDRCVGGMAFNWPGPRIFDDDEKKLVEALARQAAQALERARLYDEAEAGRQRLLEASRVKDEFLAIVSHELRTPLNAVLGWASMLRANPNFDIKLGIETIERNARAQGRLVEDMLDASRMITGKLKVEPRAIDAACVLRSALSMVSPTATSKGVQLETRIEVDPCPVTADADRLQQVFWNLLSNAIKFTPKGGSASVRLARSEDGTRIELTVRDTGRGIHPDFLPHVFDRFRQADTSTTRTEGGLGLGLAIAQHIVALHEGTITAQSPGEGGGATFTVSLPARPEPVDEPSPASRRGPAPSAPPENRLEGVVVVVCDDDPDARVLLSVVLGGAGAIVHPSSMADEAVQLVEEIRPDVIVCDIGLPVVDGYALMRTVRALPPERGGSTPAIALTAYASGGDARLALDAGYQLHVAKPNDPAELVAAVASVTGRKAERDG